MNPVQPRCALPCTDTPPFPLIWRNWSRIDSTQKACERLWKSGVLPPDTITIGLARDQYAGHGRCNRAWHALAKNALYCSILFPIALPVYRLPAIGLVIACSLLQAAQACSPLPYAGIQWPNDLVLRQPNGAWAKWGGVLVDALEKKTDSTLLLIGIGANLGPQLAHPHTAPCFPTKPWCTLAAHSLEALRIELFPRLWANLARFVTQGWSAFHEEWSQWDILKGQTWSGTYGNVPLHGTAHGVDEWGRLRVQLPDGSERLVSHTR